METDYAIVGGGIVGLSVAWGLLRRGLTVTVLDGDDGSFRASRGNFGLVWVQSKGMNQPRYAQWSQQSAAIWADFANEVADNTGQTIPLEQNGVRFFWHINRCAYILFRVVNWKIKKNSN